MKSHHQLASAGLAVLLSVSATGAAAQVKASVSTSAAATATVGGAPMMPSKNIGAPMLPSKNIVDNAVISNDRTILAAAGKATASTSAAVMVGGAPMLPTKDIIDNAVNSKDHTTLVAAVKAAGLVETLKGPGPFTVFAPTNAAFSDLPTGTVDTLLKPENKAMLSGVLTYHVVAGKMDAAALTKAIADGGGRAMLKTVAGGNLTAKAVMGGVTITDEKGVAANVMIADVNQSNGVIHVVDKVLLPK